MPEYSHRKFQLELGKNVVLPNASITKSLSIKIRDNTRINGAINIRGSGCCEIGKYCAIGYDVRIITSDHDYKFANLQIAMHEKFGFKNSIIKRKGDVKLGNNVWIGDNVTILSGVNLGNGSIVGAGSVVTHDVEAFSIVIGNPAKILKYRFVEFLPHPNPTKQYHPDNLGFFFQSDTLKFSLDSRSRLKTPQRRVLRQNQHPQLNHYPN